MNPKSSLLANHSHHLHVFYSQSLFSSKEFLPLKSDKLWRIDSGVVRSLTWDSEGKIITLGFWGKGDVVGRPLSKMSPYQVECLSNVKVSEIAPENGYLQKALLTHAWKSEEFLKIIHQLSATDRLFHLLVWLSKYFGKPVVSDILLDFQLTHQNLAETIGSTRVTVTRLLNRLERKGKIKRLKRKLFICT